jgi:hypothetical protein
MKRQLLPLLVLLFGAACAVSQTAPVPLAQSPKDCSLKPDQLDALLALPFMSFDQDHSGGWRALANRGCRLAAAMLIDTYIVDERAEMNTSQREDLYFHAGQLYAMVDLRQLAVRRVLRSLNLHEPPDADLAWNTYVLATAAFLRGDRDELAHQRNLLAAAKSTRENKINLGVIDGLAKCFDKGYNDAYSTGCRAPIQ